MTKTTNHFGLKHSFNDEPAVIKSDGTEEWWSNGLRHRDNGPAIIRTNGDKLWWQNGKLHRSDGPAVVTKTVESWYFNGKLHRDGGPAVTGSHCKKWYNYGLLHRDNGPSCEYIKCNRDNCRECKDDNDEIYHKNGIRYTKDGVLYNYSVETCDLSYISYHDYRMIYFSDGMIHNTEGPAIIKINGGEKWYICNVLHREDGPAVIKSNGTKKYYSNGKLHNKFGFAIKYPNGGGKYYIDNVEVSADVIKNNIVNEINRLTSLYRTTI